MGKKKEVKHPYLMKIERTIVDDLGVRLYDKVSAVVSELIANAYDADAEEVTVKVPLGKALANKKEGKLQQAGYCVEVSDDGHGMTPKEANDFFLKVGKHRRDDPRQGKTSREKKRPVMGRKGLGKLAPFGVCKKIEVRSAGGEKTSEGYLVTHFELDYDEIIGETKKGPDYHPKPLKEDKTWDKRRGTTIVLRDFFSKKVPERETFARQISSRFGLGSGDFNIKIVDVKEEPEAELDIREYEIPTMPGTKIDVVGRPVITESGEELPVVGWVGMAKQSYKNEEFAGVRIYVRGKLASATRDFGQPAGFTGEYVARSYLVGKISADWLDEDSAEDLIQTHRQDILWSSERGRALSEWGKDIIKEVARKGRAPRQEIVRQEFLEVSNLKERARARFKSPELETTAVELGETIGMFAHEDELKDKEYVEDLSEMILAVAPHKLLVDTFKKINDLAKEGKVDIKELMKLFETSKIAQLASYGQIVAEKLEAITLLESLLGTKDDPPEKELQKILEEAPWLVHPSWVPLTQNQTLKTFRDAFETWYAKEHDCEICTTTKISEEKKRPDFVFLHMDNYLIIVEIKPPGHVFNDEDYDRMERYSDAVKIFLEKNKGFLNDFPKGPKTILIRDGIKVSPKTEKAIKHLESEDRLEQKGWQELLRDAKRAHQDFLQARDNFGS